MMEALRKHMKQIMWLIAAMFIGGIFFWYGKIGNVSDTVAKINGSKIKLNDYQKKVTQQLRRMRDNQEEELTDQQIVQIRSQVLSSLITQEALYITSKKMGIVVTDEEIVQTIHNLPQFQQDGKFNFNLYMQSLYSLNMVPDEFELSLKKSIANRKLERLILSSAKVTTPELQIHYVNKNGNMEGFEEKAEELRNEILQSKRTALYQNWMKSLQQNTKIEVNQKLAGLAK
jgi:peptidyl-prolyl cis-trans isomerase D